MLRRTVAAFAAAMFVIALTACGGALKGSYKSEGFLSQTWTFTSNNGVTLSAGGGLVSSSGTYRIDGDFIIVTSSLLGVESTTKYTFERRGNTLLIDGEKFNKQ